MNETDPVVYRTMTARTGTQLGGFGLGFVLVLLLCMLVDVDSVQASKPEADAEFTPVMAVAEINGLLQDYRKNCRFSDDRYCWAFRRLLAQGHNRVRNRDFASAMKNYRPAIRLQTDSIHARELTGDIVDILKRITEEREVELETTVELAAAKEAARNGKTYHVFEVDNLRVEEIWPGESRSGIIYRKVTHAWGGVYYFRKGRSMSKASWQAMFAKLNETDVSQGAQIQ